MCIILREKTEYGQSIKYAQKRIKMNNYLKSEIKRAYLFDLNIRIKSSLRLMLKWCNGQHSASLEMYIDVCCASSAKTIFFLLRNDQSILIDFLVSMNGPNQGKFHKNLKFCSKDATCLFFNVEGTPQRLENIIEGCSGSFFSKSHCTCQENHDIIACKKGFITQTNKEQSL